MASPQATQVSITWSLDQTAMGRIADGLQVILEVMESHGVSHQEIQTVLQQMEVVQDILDWLIARRLSDESPDF